MTDMPAYLIRKRFSWYRPNSQGYTESAIQAGRYTLAEAEDITHPNGPDGPRDGMDYVHENDVDDLDWQAYRALRAALTDAEATIAALTQANAALAQDNARLGKRVEEARGVVHLALTEPRGWQQRARAWLAGGDA